jgi:hypothetical protein
MWTTAESKSSIRTAAEAEAHPAEQPSRSLAVLAQEVRVHHPATSFTH